MAQIDAAHGPQVGDRGPPRSHTSCEHGSRHAPFAHFCEQQSVLVMHAEPLGVHTIGPQTLLLQMPVQHCGPAMHGAPSGMHIIGPQTLFVQSPLQHSIGEPHLEPSG